MFTLVAPDGTRYETDNEDEIRNLTLGHGYHLLAESGPESQQDSETATDEDNEADVNDELI